MSQIQSPRDIDPGVTKFMKVFNAFKNLFPSRDRFEISSLIVVPLQLLWLGFVWILSAIFRPRQTAHKLVELFKRNDKADASNTDVKA